MTLLMSANHLKAQKTDIRPVYPSRDTLDLQKITRSPHVSVQQYLKGAISGVHVQERSGEPGVMQSMLVRGLSSPVFSGRDVPGVQPAVFINGVPLLMNDAYALGIKSVDVNPVGTGTNLLSGLNLDGIASLEVVKDAAQLAELGPLAANGAILIQLKDGYYGNDNVFMHVNGGVATPPNNIRMTNAANARLFREQFAVACTDDDQRTRFLEHVPTWMQDPRDARFFGAPGWASRYYRVAPLYNMNASIGGGTRNANYIVMAGYTGAGGVSDESALDKFVTNFALNMTLINKLGINCLINVSWLSRTGNRDLRDRYAEVEYLPDLTTPLSPASDAYSAYLDKYDGYTRNDNLNNMINGYLGLHYSWKTLHADSRLLFDYNTNVRHVFWPSTLMESVSFVSDYSGYNRRLSWQSTLSWLLTARDVHRFDVKLQETVQLDVQHYNYTKAYDGIDDTKPTTQGGDFTYINRYVDKMENRLISSLLSARYRYKELFDLQALLRYDAASTIQRDSRWFLTPTFSLQYNLKNHLFPSAGVVSNWAMRGSWARVGQVLDDNRFAAGPQYTGEELTGVGQPVVSSYYGYSTIARPYNSGWTGYGIRWPYSDKWNVDMSVSLLRDRLSIELAYYNHTHRDMVAAIPVTREYGYKYKYENGMDMRNAGVEVNVLLRPFDKPGVFSWDISLATAYNKNELLALPGHADELVIGDRKLKVGRAIDAFWVYENEGVHESDAAVPSGHGVKLSMNGIPFAKNDPVWKDAFEDNVINEKDKVMKGHILPPFTGNLSSTFRYRRFDVGIHLFWAAGHDALNYRSSQRYNFMELENSQSLESVKEIFFWQETNDRNDYPIYNVMSGLTPYRADQDLFLEKAWYLKMRSLTLGYALSINKKEENNVYLYVTANNLFTVTNFGGDDPELVDFDGFYRGYGKPLSPSVIMGLKYNF
jgi:TonB-linked SusC/RagA family outer membrane protein